MKDESTFFWSHSLEHTCNTLLTSRHVDIRTPPRTPASLSSTHGVATVNGGAEVVEFVRLEAGGSIRRVNRHSTLELVLGALK